MRRFTATAFTLALLSAGASPLSSQTLQPVSGEVTYWPNTQGTLSAQSATDSSGQYFSDYVWLGETEPGPDAVGQDVHLTLAGNLASFDFAYLTPSSVGSVTAIVSFHTNTPTDAVAPAPGAEIATFVPGLTGDRRLPPACEIASYTIPDLPAGVHVITHDVFDAVPVPLDMWMTVEILQEDGNGGLWHGGSWMGAGAFGPNPGLNLGTTHHNTWFQEFAAIPFGSVVWILDGIFPTGLGFQLVDPASHIFAVRVFPGNGAPVCAADISGAELAFLDPSPGSFVVTEGETITFPLTGTDPDGDALTLSAATNGVAGLPSGAMLTPTSGPVPLASTFTWTPVAADKAGAPYELRFTYVDPSGATGPACLRIEDVNLRPTCSANDETVTATGPEGAAVTLDGSATDPDDDDANLMYHWDVSNESVLLDDDESATPTGTFPIGVTMATLTVTDGRGGVSVCDALVTVQSQTPPEVMCTTDVDALWPPNHKMQTVSLVVTATDGVSAPNTIVPIQVLVRSNEPDDAAGNGDGATTGDVDGSDGFAPAPGTGVDVTSQLIYDALTEQWTGTIELRAERAGSGVGRKYTIDVNALDTSGVVASTSCCVVVPHDRRGN